MSIPPAPAHLNRKKHTELLPTGQKHLLELLALDASLATILDALLRMVEAQSDAGLLGSILLMDNDGMHLRLGAAPSLPVAYSRAIDGIAIGENIGSCGAAAFRRMPVHTPDIARDPLWQGFHKLAAQHRLASCWSTPIFSGSGEVLGTFAMYYREAREADEGDLRHVNDVTRTAAIAIERERAQQVLRASEERYQLINRATNDIIWDWDFITDSVNWNEAAMTQLGYARDELGTHSESRYEKIHADDRERVVNGIHAAIDGNGAAWSDEYRYRKQDNSYASFLDRGFIARDAAGKAYRMIGAMLDVTARKCHDEALLNSQKRFRTIFDQTIVGVVQTDAGGRMTLVNQHWCDMLGYSEAELLQKNVLDVTHQASLAATTEAVAQLAAGSPDFIIEKRYVRKDGTSFWASSSVNALRNSDDEFIGLVAMVLDMTERKAAEDALKVSEKNSLDILQSITDGFLALDEDWHLLYLNHAAERLMRQTAVELVGKNFWQLYPDLVGSEFERNYRQVAATRKPLAFTACYPKHNRWYEANVYPAVQGISVYFRDVSDRIKSQQALRRRDQRSSLIADISAWLVLRASYKQSESVDQLLESVLLSVAQYLHAEYYFNFAVDNERQALRLVSSLGLDAVQKEKLAHIGFGDYLSGQVAVTHQPLILRDMQTQAEPAAAPLCALQVQAYAGFPLLADGHLLGTISFATTGRTSFDDEELELIQTVTDLLAIAIQRDRTTFAVYLSEQKYRSLFESIDEGFCVIEVLFDDRRQPVDYRYLETNPAFARQTGMRDAVGKTIRELAPGIEDYWIEILGKVAISGEAQRFEEYAAPLHRWFSCYCFRIDAAEPNKVGIIFSDATERKRREMGLQLLADIQHDFALLNDVEALLPSISEKIRRHFAFAVFGLADINESSGMAIPVYNALAPGIVVPTDSQLLADFLNPADLRELKAGKVVAIDDTTQPGIKNAGARYMQYQAGAIIIAPYLSDGRWKFALAGTHRQAYHWQPGEIELLCELAARIYLHLERLRAVALLSESEARYRALIDASSEIMYRMNADLTSLILIEGGDVIASSHAPQGDWLASYIHPEDQMQVMLTWRQALQDKRIFELEHRVRRIDGSWGWVFSRAVPLLDAHGEVSEWFGAATDITERKRFEDTLWQSANFDSLTGLPNRRLFHDRLEQELKKAHRSGLAVALFFIDLDRFKEVNDLHGHNVGDMLLVEASKRISACVREFDTVARLGGDEFTAILSELEDKSRSSIVAEKIIATLAQPFRLGVETIHLSSSIGITYFPDDAGHADDMIRNADQAMYAAKYAGRNRYNYFMRGMQHEVQDRLRLIEDLRAAAAGGQFEVYYQPVVDLASGRIAKAEALLRWHHPQHGNIDPSVFIPFAEDSGLINEIGDWVFTEAAACSKICEARTGAHFQISVNKSPVQFRTAGSLDWVSYLDKHNLSAGSVSIEITEGLLLNTSQETRSKLKKLRGAGIEVAIDDFGTGYSSMAYLKEFEIDYLKIDQSFIHAIASDKAHFAIVRSMIAMAHELDIRVIAEGIETPEQEALLLGAGCDFGQGYLFAQARPPAEFLRMLN